MESYWSKFYQPLTKVRFIYDVPFSNFPLILAKCTEITKKFDCDLFIKILFVPPYKSYYPTKFVPIILKDPVYTSRETSHGRKKWNRCSLEIIVP